MCAISYYWFVGSIVVPEFYNPSFFRVVKINLSVVILGFTEVGPVLDLRASGDTVLVGF
jgi:hypothetical protein